MKLAFLFNVAMMLGYIVTVSSNPDDIARLGFFGLVHAALAGACRHFMKEYPDE